MLLSVVLALVDGGDTLEDCLRGLEAQEDPPDMEILVAYDDTVPGMDLMAKRYPKVRFLDMGHIETTSPQEMHSGHHELIDKRRAWALAEAKGDIVAVIEDRGVPEPAWAKTLVRVHELPYAAIGGAVSNSVDDILNWAVYIADFGRYGRPLKEGPAEYLTDVNISYKRRAIEATRQLWQDRYHETTVNWGLRNSGETLWLTPEFGVVQKRRNLSLRGLLPERFHWGRLFAYTRVKDVGLLKRAFYAAGTPLVPTLLYLRHARRLLRNGDFSLAIKVSPALFVLLSAWVAGETVGYVTAKA